MRPRLTKTKIDVKGISFVYNIFGSIKIEIHECSIVHFMIERKKFLPPTLISYLGIISVKNAKVTLYK